VARHGVTDVCQELIYRAELPAVLVAAGQARRQLNAVLASWQMPSAVVGDAALLLTEIFTNAVRFGAGPEYEKSVPSDTRKVGMIFRFLAGELVIEVRDDSLTPPVLTEPGQSAEHGRGLQVVDKLSDRWGYNPLPTPGGKTVYCILNTGTA
jgi:anti-sigma regulatory factor (Ser/Thr protein kinase)